jgi:hypothetical protein
LALDFVAIFVHTSDDYSKQSQTASPADRRTVGFGRESLKAREKEGLCTSNKQILNVSPALTVSLYT